MGCRLLSLSLGREEGGLIGEERQRQRATPIGVRQHRLTHLRFQTDGEEASEAASGETAAQAPQAPGSRFNDVVSERCKRGGAVETQFLPMDRWIKVLEGRRWDRCWKMRRTQASDWRWSKQTK